MPTKRCTKCNKIKSFDCFYKSKLGKYGLTSVCKECLKIYRKDKAYKEYKAQWYQKNKEAIKLYNENRKEIRKDYMSKRYHNYRDKIIAKQAAWAKANPDKIRAHTQRHRAKKKGNGGKHTAADVQRQGEMQKWICWWQGPGCEGYCKDKYHVDHIIPLDRGGHNDPSNIVISCPHCNCSKSNKLPEEWIGRLF